MKTVYYLGYYDVECNKRNIVLSSINKMSYIIEAMEKSGCCVNVISASHTLERKKSPDECVDIGKNSKLYLFKSLPWGGKIQRVSSYIFTFYQVYKFLINNLTKNDVLVVYHSLSYMSLVRKAKRKIGFKLILEVEEIYSDVNNNISDREKEFKLFKSADSYLFSTELLDTRINTEKKPSAVIYGTYKIEKDRKCNIFNDNIQSDTEQTIHVVYAGTFDPRKGGGAAAAAAEFLPKNYHIHILGFGNETDTNSIKKLIADVSKKSAATVTYDGLLSGEDYIKFIQSCDIGLSTQNPNASFNNTSFPSKILSYMANGLRVVSIRIPAIEESAVGEDMYFYDEQTPKEIAKAILDVNLGDDYDGRKKIAELDKKFCEDIKLLLENTK